MTMKHFKETAKNLVKRLKQTKKIVLTDIGPQQKK